MSRMPLKKRSQVFLDSSCSESDDDESFNPDGGNSNSDNYLASDDDECEVICTQPVPRKKTEAATRPESTNLHKDGPLVMDERNQEFLCNALSIGEGSAQSPVATLKPNITTHVVTDLNSPAVPDNEAIEILEPPKKLSKLKLKIKRSNSQKRKQDIEVPDITLSKSDKKAKSTPVVAKPILGRNPADNNSKCDRKIEVTDSQHQVETEKTEVNNVNDELKAANTMATESNSSPAALSAESKCASQKKQTEASGITVHSSGVKRKKKRKIGNHSKTMKKLEPVTSQMSIASGKTGASNDPVIPVKKPKKKTFQQQVILHLITSMKPFTLKTLAAELRTTDVVLSHMMLSLQDKNIVRKKEFGKKIKKELFWVDLEKATNEYYGKKLPTKHEMLQSELQLKTSLSEETSVMEILKGMESELSNEELIIKLENAEKIAEELRTMVQNIKGRIEGKKSINGAPIVKGLGHQKHGRFAKNCAPKLKTRNQLCKEINDMRSEWKVRKEKCVDFIDTLSDAMEKRPKEVDKMLDIETDEMIGVKIPAKKVLQYQGP